MRLAILDHTPPTSTQVSIPRALGATLALGATGASVGAILCATLFGVLGLMANDAGCFPIPVSYVVAAGGSLGGGFGGIALPLIAWGLPSVAIGRIIGAAVIGTIAGGIGGFLVMNLDLAAATLGSFIGFAVAMSRVGFRASRAADNEPG